MLRQLAKRLQILDQTHLLVWAFGSLKVKSDHCHPTPNWAGDTCDLTAIVQYGAVGPRLPKAHLAGEFPKVGPDTRGRAPRLPFP